MFVTLLLHSGRWGRRALVLLAPLAVVPFTLALTDWARAHTFAPVDMNDVASAPANRFRDLAYALPILHRSLVQAVLFVIGLSGVALLPLALGIASWQRWKAAATVAAIASLIAVAISSAGIDVWIPLASGETWAFDELGATAPLVPEYQGGLALSSGEQWALRIAALVLGSIVFSAIAPSLRTIGESFVGWTLIAYLALASVLWLFNYDRYGLVFLPLVIMLVLMRRPALRFWPALAGIALYAIISGIGMRDHLAYSRALWESVNSLRERGIPTADIDGGYVVNGWLQYLHPESAHRTPDGTIAIPGINAKEVPPYAVANAPAPNASVIGTVSYSRWLRPDGELYLLRR